MRSGDEQDAFSRRARKILSWRAGERHAIKQRYARWQRKLGRLMAQSEARTDSRD
ncbi:hypothetical protein AEGHOMDF_4494 [Methylobacterium soli]|nr:hypothetical protein AEGHOMDF_4494 [Methylobacterium soli]